MFISLLIHNGWSNFEGNKCIIVMKWMLILVGVIASCEVLAQSVALEGGKYAFHKAERAKASKHELYDKAMSWVSDHLAETKGAVRYKSEQNGQIVMNGSIEHVMKGVPCMIGYTMVIEFRSGVYKETFKDFNYRKGSQTLPFESKKLKNKKVILEYTETEVTKLSDSLMDFMSRDILALN